MPRFCSRVFTIPLSVKRLNATEYTSTQLMKLGRVVRVCTRFLNHLHLISFRKTANPMGSMDVRIPSRLMANVFFITCTICATCVLLAKRVLNHFKPTKSHCDNLSGGL